MLDRYATSPRHRTKQVSAALPPLSLLRAMMLFTAMAIAILQISLPVSAQSVSVAMPENAHAKSYGDGWECDIGFRDEDEMCLPIVVPQNAYQTNRIYGAGWECMHGFKSDGNTACAEVIVPEGGYLDPSGQRWLCLRGFQKVGKGCLEIVLPKNAYLAKGLYGSEWACKRGYEAIGEGCSAIVVPENAYLNVSKYGQPWSCERGFIEEARQCVAVAVPVNAYFDDAPYGDGWKCDRGYAAKDGRCEAIDLPENAHLDRTGNRWECHRNYQKYKKSCVLSN